MKPRELLLFLRLCPAIPRQTVKVAAQKLLQRNFKKWDLQSFLKTDLKLSTSQQQQLFSTATYQVVRRNLSGSSFITLLDAAYPRRLKEIYDPPVVLFFQGNWQLVQQKYLLAVVGARKNSSYAKRVINYLLIPLLERKVVLISGLAAGVDSLVHQLSLRFNCPTIAVIGTGLARYYPQGNLELQQRIANQCLVISEYSCDEGPLAYHFPARNRIIAGLAENLLVVEARHQSGSLITANLALQENRNVLAVPGPVDSILSVGTNELIAAGAKPALSATDIWEEFLQT